MAELKRCKKCGKISSWNSYFDGYMCECGNIERKTTTNADRIRAMSDEELADLFCYRGCPPDRLTGKCVKVGVCEACWVVWLKQPVGEVV